MEVSHGRYILIIVKKQPDDKYDHLILPGSAQHFLQKIQAEIVYFFGFTENKLFCALSVDSNKALC